MKFKITIILELLMLAAFLFWSYVEKSTEAYVATFSGLITLIITYLKMSPKGDEKSLLSQDISAHSRLTITAKDEGEVELRDSFNNNYNNSQNTTIINHGQARSTDEKKNDVDILLYNELVLALPHDDNMDYWLRDKDLMVRSICFDYFDLVREFKNKFQKKTVFFHNEELNQKLEEALNSIQHFQRRAAQYVVPCGHGENNFGISRHLDRCEDYSQKKDADENKKGQELNKLATNIYEKLIDLYTSARRVLVI